ncbi:MAG: PKD domain-containing protein [Thermoplasmata archaeon]|nr:PKD domain-containing protein [Thermoplasmata archaeon]
MVLPFLVALMCLQLGPVKPTPFPMRAATPFPPATPLPGSPPAGTWVQKAPVPVPVADMPVAPCTVNGVTYLFVVGGYKEWMWNNPNHMIAANNLQRYDPASDTWSQDAPLPLAAWGGSAASLNGRIYYFSGVYLNANNAVMESRETQVYDCASHAWTIASAGTPFGGTGSVAVAHGDVILVLMGTNLWAYNAASDTWTDRASHPNSKRWCTFARLGSKVYVLGGYEAGRAAASVDAYDVPTNTWTSNVATAPRAAWGMARESVVINGWIVYAFGLTSVVGDFVSQAYLFNPATLAWMKMPNARNARDGIGGAVLGNTFYALGGRNRGGFAQGLDYNEQLTITSTLIARPFAPPGVVAVGQTVTFSCAPRGGVMPYRYAWNFGDGTAGDGASVAHEYASAGTYLVSVTVTDVTGWTNTSVLPTIAVQATSPASSDGVLQVGMAAMVAAATVAVTSERSRRKKHP